MPIDSFPYQALYKLSRKLHRQSGDANVIKMGLSTACEIAGVVWGSVITLDERGSVSNVYTLNQDIAISDGDRGQVYLSDDLIAAVYHERRTIIMSDIAEELRLNLRSGSVLGAPLIVENEIRGVMILAHARVGYFDDDHARLVNEIIELMSDALSFNHVKRINDGAITTSNYQILFDDAVVPIILTDLTGEIVDVNRQATTLLGYDRDDLIGQSIRYVHKDIDLDNIGSDGLSNLENEEENTFRTVARTLFEEIPVIVRVRRLLLDDRDVVEWLEQDITTQMELEQLRRDLTAMIYHDLRGPLQAISGSIQKLGEVLANHENPTVLTLLHIGIRSTRQLRRMIDSLLDIQRLEEGSAILDRRQVEPRVLLADAIQLVQPLLFESGQRLEFNLQDDIPIIFIDSDMIMRVVINLMENACKYSPRDGLIELNAILDGDELLISVADSGPGIPPEMQTRIFDKFNRVKYQNGPAGLGLGLAFCRLAVNAHGGQIWVESKDNAGSCFAFTIPVNSQSADDLFTELVSTH